MQTIPAKTIVTRTRSRWWFGTDYNMNLYRGCTHGCIYCDSRSSCYHNPDFDHIAVKENALAIVRDDLRRKVQRGVVATGAMSDPYNPLERKLGLTRHALELLSAYGFGVAVDTKSDLVSRDADVLSEIAAQMPALVKFSITTADPALAARLEPGAPSPERRFAAMEQLAKAGVFTGLRLMPVLPGLTDNRENLSRLLLQNSLWQPVLAAFIGAIPNCASSVLLTELYLSGSLTFGSVVAGLTTGAGLGLVVLFKQNHNKRQNALILAALLAIGIGAGIALQLLGY